MNRKILVLLITIAGILYSYVAFLLAGGSLFAEREEKKIEKGNTDISIDKLVLSAVPVKFEKKNRDPFLPYEQKPVKAAVPKSKPVTKAVPKKDPPKPPLISITGIMWNPSNPLAMVNMPDGAGIVARNGLVAGSITFKKIEQNRILVLNEGKEFWINR